jgi:glycosyltransferase involved in cell wall biosynthesis
VSASASDESLSEPELPSVSVVMPTFNRRDLLVRVLEPLLADSTAAEIIVVVDGSVDGSLELLESMAQRDARLRAVRIPNSGMVQARVHGAQLAQGEVVLLLDDDVEVDPGAVAGHARAHAAGRQLVVVGSMPVVGGPQNGPLDYPRAMYAREYVRHCQRWIDDPASVLRTLWEGHLSLRRADMLALDGPALPEIERAYHCDVDFGLRCQTAGLTGLFVPQLRAHHHFTRNPDEFVRDARSSGRGLLLLHQVHAGQLGVFDEARLLESVPGPLRPVVRVAIGRTRAVALIGRAISVLGRAHLFRLQRAAAYVLRVTEQLREVRRIRAGDPRPAGGVS